jgi:hypothetical protein
VTISRRCGLSCCSESSSCWSRPSCQLTWKHIGGCGFLGRIWSQSFGVYSATAGYCFSYWSSLSSAPTQVSNVHGRLTRHDIPSRSIDFLLKLGTASIGTIIQFFGQGQSIYLDIQSTRCIFLQNHSVSHSVNVAFLITQLKNSALLSINMG